MKLYIFCYFIGVITKIIKPGLICKTHIGPIAFVRQVSPSVRHGNSPGWGLFMSWGHLADNPGWELLMSWGNLADTVRTTLVGGSLCPGGTGRTIGGHGDILQTIASLLDLKPSPYSA